MWWSAWELDVLWIVVTISSPRKTYSNSTPQLPLEARNYYGFVVCECICVLLAWVLLLVYQCMFYICLNNTNLLMYWFITNKKSSTLTFFSLNLNWNWLLQRSASWRRDCLLGKTFLFLLKVTLLWILVCVKNTKSIKSVVVYIRICRMINKLKTCWKTTKIVLCLEVIWTKWNT